MVASSNVASVIITSFNLYSLLDSFNPIWFAWILSILLFGIYVGCLCSMGAYAPGSASSSGHLRLLSFLGLIVTASMSFFWLATKLNYVAILIFPAMICFAVLIFRPMLARESKKLRIYLTVCVAFGVLTICMEFIATLAGW
jgi:hypothetical protein